MRIDAQNWDVTQVTPITESMLMPNANPFKLAIRHLLTSKTKPMATFTNYTFVAYHESICILEQLYFGPNTKSSFLPGVSVPRILESKLSGKKKIASITTTTVVLVSYWDGFYPLLQDFLQIVSDGKIRKYYIFILSPPASVIQNYQLSYPMLEQGIILIPQKIIGGKSIIDIENLYQVTYTFPTMHDIISSNWMVTFL